MVVSVVAPDCKTVLHTFTLILREISDVNLILVIIGVMFMNAAWCQCSFIVIQGQKSWLVMRKKENSTCHTVSETIPRLTDLSTDSCQRYLDGRGRYSRYTMCGYSVVRGHGPCTQIWTWGTSRYTHYGFIYTPGSPYSLHSWCPYADVA